MMNKKFVQTTFGRLQPALLALALSIGASSAAFAAATITIVNGDPVNVGFNDATAAAPVGGNTGTTLGQQRLIAFQSAADKWGATLDSAVTIRVLATWEALTCTSTTAVLGSAGATQVFSNFPGAPFANTFYGKALTGKLFGADPDSTTADIRARFNVNLGQNANCLPGTPFYLGIDNNHGTAIDLVSVLTHEFAHGLGFQTFTSGSTGAPLSGVPSIYDRFLIDLTSGKSWLNMTDAERAASALNSRKLAWNGPQVLADLPNVLALGTPLLKINSPAIIAGNYDFGAASFGPAITATGITGNVVLALDPNDASGTSTTDGCSALTNAAAIAGNIAMIDRGNCGFTVKVLNAQNAGAIAVIIADNAAGSPPAGLGGADPAVTIPAVRVTLPDANAIKAQLGTGVNVTIKLDSTVRAGSDPFGKALMFSPNPFQSGSSVSHWDTSAQPNLLMEPAINADLTHEVTPPNDLSYSQMRDIGWVASVLPNAIVKTSGNLQNTQSNESFATPLTVTTTPAASGLSVTWTVNPNSAGVSAAFPSTSSRFAVSTTDAFGVATAPTLTANGQSGNYFMNATVPGAGTTAFALTNSPPRLAGAACITDTTQANFLDGVTSNTDVNASPGNVVLLNPANVDQQNTSLSTSGVGFNATTWGGQTFTPAVTGQLAKVDINLFCSTCTGTFPNLTMSVRATSGNLPTGPDLATATVAGFNSGASGFVGGTFATPATLTAGTTYAILIRPVSNPSAGLYALTRSGTDVYAGGQRVSSSDSGATWTAPLTSSATTDAGFVTYMQTAYSPAGDFVSSVKDANAPATLTTVWSSLAWNSTVPANTTLQFQVAASNNFAGPFNFVGPDGTTATFFANGASLAQFNGFRYLKSKAFLTTSNTSITPTLNDTTVCYNNAALPDLSIAKAHVGASFTQGQKGAQYTLSVTNGGVAATSGTVTVTDTLPAGLTFVSGTGTGWACSAAGQAVTCIDAATPIGVAATSVITLNVNVAGAAAATLSNSAAVACSCTESNNANNTSSTDVVVVNLAPDLTLTKSHSGNFVQGQVGATYTITVNNTGSADKVAAAVVTVTDTAPAGLTITAMSGTGWTCTTLPTCTRSDVLATGASYAPITVTVTVATNASTPQINSASVSTTAIEQNTTNNTATDSTVVLVPPDMTVTKTHIGNFSQGQTGATYTVTVSNSGLGSKLVPDVVTVTDTPPTGLTITAMSGSGWTCATLPTCTRSDVLIANASYPPITVIVSVAANATSPKVNSVAVSTTALESNSGNNTATDSTVILVPPDLTISKSHVGNLLQGQTGATYASLVTNLGAGDKLAGGMVTVTDTPPPGLTITAMSGTGWTCTTLPTCTRSDLLSAGFSYPSITITATVAGSAASPLVNSIAVSTTAFESNTANNTATDSATVITAPDLTVNKSHVGDFSLGQIGAKYTVVVTNSGAGDKAAGSVVTLVDTAPSGLTITAISGAGWTCATLTTCTRSDALLSGVSYPAITVSVNVGAAATSPQVNAVSVTTAATESNPVNNLGTDATNIVTGTAGSLTVSKFGSGSGSVTSQDGGIACGATCTASYVNGSDILLTATPVAGSVFTGWLGPCSGTGSTCTVPISGAATVSATFALSTIGTRILDIDASTSYLAASDGTLILRYILGMRGATLTNGVVLGAAATRTGDPEMSAYLLDILPLLDVDGNGKVDALTDGLMIMRKLLGQTGTAITANALGAGATRNTAEIEAYIQTLKPP